MKQIERMKRIEQMKRIERMKRIEQAYTLCAGLGRPTAVNVKSVPR